MSVFEDIHASTVIGSLTMFDRLIFKGHLTRLFRPDALRAFLWTQGFPLTEWTKFVTAATEAISLNAQALASQAGRPYIHLEGLATRSATSKEDLARGIASETALLRAWSASCGRLSPAVRSMSDATTEPTSSRSPVGSANAPTTTSTSLIPSSASSMSASRAGCLTRSRST
jgi:hypothetical protein